MKRLLGLDRRLDHFDRSAPQHAKDDLPPLRKMFLDVLGGSPADNGEQSILMYRLGIKIADAPVDSLELEDAEFNLLKDKCLKNGLRWMAHYQAQVILRLQEAEKVGKP